MYESNDRPDFLVFSDEFSRPAFLVGLPNRRRPALVLAFSVFLLPAAIRTPGGRERQPAGEQSRHHPEEPEIGRFADDQQQAQSVDGGVPGDDRDDSAARRLRQRPRDVEQRRQEIAHTSNAIQNSQPSCGLIAASTRQAPAHPSRPRRRKYRKPTKPSRS